MAERIAREDYAKRTGRPYSAVVGIRMATWEIWDCLDRARDRLEEEKAMNKTTTITIDLSLRDWRMRMGWTRTQAAEALGIARNSYRKYELDQEDNVPPPRYIRLAAAAILTNLMPLRA